MPHRNSDAVQIKLDDATGSIVDISGDVNSLSWDGGQNLLDDTGMNDTRHTVVAGLANASNAALNGWINSTTQAVFEPLVDGTSITKTYGHTIDDGTTWWTGEVWPEAITISASIDALQTWSAGLRAQNGLTSTSVAPA